jgi:hypothetical protein
MTFHVFIAFYVSNRDFRIYALKVQTELIETELASNDQLGHRSANMTPKLCSVHSCDDTCCKISSLSVAERYLWNKSTTAQSQDIHIFDDKYGKIIDNNRCQP